MSATIKPGTFGNEERTERQAAVGEISPVDTILDIIRQVVPDNIMYAMTAQVDDRFIIQKIFKCAFRSKRFAK